MKRQEQDAGVNRNIVNEWCTRATPFSPLPSSPPHDEEEEQEVKCENNENMQIQCKILVRSARNLKWHHINELATWHRLPYKYLWKIEVPLPLINSTDDVKIILIRDSDACEVIDGIQYQYDSMDVNERLYVIQYKVYFNTSSFLHKKSRFRVVLEHAQTKVRLMVSDPKKIFARKRLKKQKEATSEKTSTTKV